MDQPSSLSSSGQQQGSGINSSASSFVSPSPGSSSASVLLGPSSSVYRHSIAPRSSSLVIRRRRSSSDSKGDDENQHNTPTLTSSSSSSSCINGATTPDSSGRQQLLLSSPPRSSRSSLIDSAARAQSRSARKLNDSMVYLDGPQIYTCAQCRTHLTSHDEIISKSFHGRHGRAYLFDDCVNVTIGPAEDRILITGLHSVCDIFCKRCKNLVGWTYYRAYEDSQKYKEGKFIVEKINLHLEESDYYDVAPPAGERKDRFRARSISWGSDCCHQQGTNGERDTGETIYEYRPSSPVVAAAAAAASTSPQPMRPSR
ncbi:yippee-domain-containing protein [Fragilariopsis cylindrus CCMP1102]|uniref:Yippee-domain-containing protein n=1 Tax=Fragilariopsis cylindrus CCMP1102 TaxID=635003 RepID=A0A1E7FSH1_9STRA|nr:yippee-domain-containing protein [Fragilariopsis cylindrus CCMP1102]|eukprot:OEU21086.1 yippee-domain-containing protein [Fragilariopsis cylindrus CCMP1102]